MHVGDGEGGWGGRRDSGRIDWAKKTAYSRKGDHHGTPVARSNSFRGKFLFWCLYILPILCQLRCALLSLLALLLQAHQKPLNTHELAVAIILITQSSFSAGRIL